MIDFETCQKAARALGETRDCAVKAVAIATQTPYEEVHHRMAERGRRFRKGTPMEITRYVLDQLADNHINVDRKAATVASVPRAYREGIYLVRTARHILAVIDGKVHDWTEGRRHRVKEVIRITPLPRLLPVDEPVDVVSVAKAMPRSQMWLIAA